MTDLLDLRSLLDLIVACNDDDAVWKAYGWVWAQEGDAASVGFHPQTRRGDDVADDGDGEPEPPITTSPRLWLYLEAITLAGILDVQKQSRPLSGLDDYAQALDYYSQHDTFLDHGEPAPHDREEADRQGLSSGLYAAFDLTLETVESAQRKAAASLVAEVKALSVGEALAQVRALPLAVACNVDRATSGALQARFAAIGLALQVTGYRSFPWQDRVQTQAG
ncbi:hypothetical protein ABIA71_003534 [Stenotrophomonas sp. 2619]|uniref:hypothetical protein n=1 Tax=Stenotrophomonas sp. 2619 TaxID=3156316 RepID=UPI003393D7B9